ncbi:MAG TPA: GDSL-type esterase/lipase family protein, partial [Fimbriimonas sp.]
MIFAKALLFAGVLQGAAAAPFAEDVARFAELDRANPPAQGQVLFIGSSSFTMWEDVQARFPGVPLLNRAFGGSQLPHLIQHLDRIVTPYAPRKVVVYCGENDLAGDPSLPAYKVAERFEALHGLIRDRLPSVPIVYVSMKPSPSRYHLRAKFIAGNRWIREFCDSQKDTSFVDVWPLMLGSDNFPREEL